MSTKPDLYIMIVDDETSIVSMLEDVMALAGFKCRGFTEPEKALAAFLSEPMAYRVLITDLTMPNLKGDAFALAAQSANPDCKIILSTGYHSESLSPHLRNFTLLQKPYRIDELLNLVQTQA